MKATIYIGQENKREITATSMCSPLQPCNEPGEDSRPCSPRSVAGPRAPQGASSAGADWV